jgi:branched-chain amino acid transport system permease protein
MFVGTFFVAGLSLGAIYALAGVGIVLLNKASGVLNFAYGAIGGVAALTCWQFLQWGSPEPFAWLTALVTGAVLSLVYGRFLAPALAYREPVVKAVATLGFALILLGFMNIFWGEQPRRMSLPTDTLGVQVLGVRVTGTRLLALLSAIGLTVGVVVFLNRTRIGLWMRAVADNRDVSALLGVRILTVETWAWTISGALAGFTGVMLATLVRLDPTVLTFLVIPAMAAAVLGRLQSLTATLIGGMSVGVVEAMLTLWTDVAPYRNAAPFIVAILMILWMQRHVKLAFSRE